MATYYPSSSAQIDVLSASYSRDEKFASYPESPLLHGNMMMYLNPATSPGSSMNPQNGVEIPSMAGRNEMMFIPPTSDPMCMQTINGETVGNNSVPGEGEQNLQGLSLSLRTQMSTAVSTASFQYQYLPLSAENSVRPLMVCKLDDTSPSKDMRNSDYFPYDLHGDGNNTIRFGVPDNPQYVMNPKAVNCNPYQYEQAGIVSTNMKPKYLKASQQLLDEVVNVRDALKRTESEKDKNSSKVDEVSKESAAGSGSIHELSPTERQDLQSKLDKLHSMLDEVDRRYKQYCQQMQIPVSSFDVVAGGGSAKPYTALALKTISRHFRCLRDAITGQIQATQKSLGVQDNGLGAIPRLRYVDQKLRQQRALQQFGMMRHAWRPQRGLPETAVTVLRAWLFEHFLHPYPKDSEKIMLARQTGLTRGQVANWFINARVRLWKPMVEEMYKEEFGDADINSRFSPENTPKLARDNKSWGSEDKREEMQESATSMAYDSHDSRTGPIPGSETKGATSSTTTMLHFGAFGTTSHDNHGFYTNSAAYQMPELGNYSVDNNNNNNNNQVSLALGLRQHEGDVMSLSSMGDGTSEYPYLDQVNQQHRFGDPNILSDFEALNQKKFSMHTLL